jgi:hypothetical protein
MWAENFSKAWEENPELILNFDWSLMGTLGGNFENASEEIGNIIPLLRHVITGDGS